jgi:hypothetical protein
MAASTIDHSTTAKSMSQDEIDTRFNAIMAANYSAELVTA